MELWIENEPLGYEVSQPMGTRVGGICRSNKIGHDYLILGGHFIPTKCLKWPKLASFLQKMITMH